MYTWNLPEKEDQKRTVEEDLLTIMLDTVKAASNSQCTDIYWDKDQLPGVPFLTRLHYGHIKHTYDDSLREFAEALKFQLKELEQLVSGCQYYARRTVFTTGLTEIALNMAELPVEGPPGFTFHPANAFVVPYMLQPPWLRINQSETIKDHEDSCCPGHCMETSCIQYCFNAMLEFADRAHHPYTSLKRDQVMGTMEPGCIESPAFYRAFGHRGPAYMMASLMLKRLLGPLTEFTHAIAILARFCSCSSTLELQARLPEVPGIQYSPEGAAAWGIAYPTKEVGVDAFIEEPRSNEERSWGGRDSRARRWGTGL